MFKKFLKSKLHGLKVVEAKVDYEGSITIDRELLQASGIDPYEMVKVINLSNGERFETYTIEGEPGSGYIGLNGGAAKKGKPGDRLLVFSSAWVKKKKKHHIKVVFINGNNKVKEIRENEITA